MDERVRILLVEDNPGDARLIEILLHRESDLELVWVDTLSGAFDRIREGGIDVVLLDLGLSDSHGLPTLTAVHGFDHNLPIVVLSGHDSDAISLAAVNAGAQDYLVKGAVDGRTIRRSVRYALDRMRITQALRASEVQLQQSNQELRQTTEQLVQSAKLTAVGELAAGIAHELSQPLNGIAVIVQAALRYFDDSSKEEVEEQMREILAMVDSMRRILDHMRQFVRPSTDTEHHFLDVNATVDRALSFVERQLIDHGISVERDFTPDLPEVLGNAQRIEQVLLNLVTNARGAFVESDKAFKQLVLKTRPSFIHGAPAVTIEVRDNGVGIPPAILSRVFEPFFTTKRAGEGTGLGLSISRKIVDEHRGQLEVDSVAGEGTVFRVVLRAHDTRS